MLVLGQSAASVVRDDAGRHNEGLRPPPAGVEDGETLSPAGARTWHRSRGRRHGLDIHYTVLCEVGVSWEGCPRN